MVDSHRSHIELDERRALSGVASPLAPVVISRFPTSNSAVDTIMELNLMWWPSDGGQIYIILK